MEELIEFTKEHLHNKPNIVISLGLSTLVLLGINLKISRYILSSTYSLCLFQHRK